jgi:hypothetical protein
MKNGTRILVAMMGLSGLSCLAYAPASGQIKVNPKSATITTQGSTSTPTPGHASQQPSPYQPASNKSVPAQKLTGSRKIALPLPE